jgi:adenosylcobinamide-GDP ribazoletransferase
VNALRSLAGAVAYFTILPLRGPDEPPGRGELGWLPMVGLVLGAMAGAAGWLAWRYGGAPWSFVVPFALAIAMTGAIHLDGFLDCCDGLFASVPPERRRQILKDPRHGTYAIAGAIVLAAIWLAALSRFPYGLGIWQSVGLFAFAGFAARCAAVCNIEVERRPFYAPVVAVLLFPVTGVGWLIKRWATDRLGGASGGDVYGAIVVVLEVAIFVAISAYG